MPTRSPAWVPPLLAVQLLTRLPVPFVARLDSDAVRRGLPRAVGWMPLVGTLVGAITAAVYVGALYLWPPPVAAGVALVAEALVTGALHEDAVADFCDAFGGSARGDDARRIMRDSRVGQLRCTRPCPAGRAALDGDGGAATSVAAAAIVAAATVGRVMPAGLLALAPPRTDGEGFGASVGAPNARTLLLALSFILPGALPLAMADPVAIAGALVAAALLLILVARSVRDRLGGSTGDCLGFAAYLGQVAVLLAALAA